MTKPTAHTAHRLFSGGWGTAQQRSKAEQAVIAALFAWVLLAAGPAFAAESGHAHRAQASAAYKSGVVTAVSTSGIQINHQNYVMARNATVTDDEGQALDLADFGPGVEVKFHVKRGKIDELIVILPR